MSGMTAPVGSSNKLDTPLLPSGFQLCTLFGLFSIGTQDSNFGKKHQVVLMFEFPQHKAVFYEGKDPQVYSVIRRETFSMAEKANLRKRLVQPMLGRVLNEKEAEVFDMSVLLGKSFVATIVHTTDGKYANIDSIAKLDDNNRKMFGVESTTLQQINPTVYFNLSDGFESENFKNLPKHYRDIIKISEEGKMHAMAGGKFAEPEKNENGNGSTQTFSSNNTTVTGGKKLQMIATDFTYEQYKSSSWTDEMLVQHGKAKWIETAPVQAPMPQAPVGPSAPTAAPTPMGAPTPITPAPVPQTPAVAPTDSTPIFVMKDKSQNMDEWKAGGWTDALLQQHGHAHWVDSVSGIPIEDDLPF